MRRDLWRPSIGLKKTRTIVKISDERKKMREGTDGVKKGQNYVEAWEGVGGKKHTVVNLLGVEAEKKSSKREREKKKKRVEGMNKERRDVLYEIGCIRKNVFFFRCG